jgi:hypothetical protein
MSTTSFTLANLSSLASQESGGAIKTKAARVTAETKGLDTQTQRVFEFVSGSLTNLQDQINAERRRLNNIITALATVSFSVTVPNVHTLEVPLPTATTTTVTTTILPSKGGDLMFVRLTEDATGGGQITWDTMFIFPSGTPVVNINTAANAQNLFCFVAFSTTPGSGDLLWLNFAFTF